MPEWLKKCRKECGYTQKDLAQLCEITQAYYAQIENGVRNPSVKVAKRLGKALGVKWTKFFD